ncbi:hypothetical protein ACQ4LE_005735 [Meloidogyne hapla]
MYFFTFISIFVSFIFFVNCGIFQTPAIQTNNYFGSISKPFPSLKTKNNQKIFALKINSSENNKWPKEIKNNLNNINLNKFPLIKPIFPKINKKSKISCCNVNYPIEDPFSNKAHQIAKILTWEFQLYKLNENEKKENNWGQKLNKEERANIILISELLCWLTLKEQLDRHFKKAVGLLIALRESDRILENANFLCCVFNYLRRINEPKELLFRWTLDELKENFWNVLEIREENEDILLRTSQVVNLLSSGDALIQLFDFTVLASPAKENARESVDKLITQISISQQWTKIVGEFLRKEDNFKGWNNSDIRFEQYKINSFPTESCCEEENEGNN